MQSVRQGLAQSIGVPEVFSITSVMKQNVIKNELGIFVFRRFVNAL